MFLTNDCGPVTLRPLSDDVLKIFTNCWPLGVKANAGENSYGIIMRQNGIEVWGICLPNMVSDEKNAGDWFEIRRTIIPLALQKIASNVSGALLAGPFMRKVFGGRWEHGLVLFPALSNSGEKNKNLMTSHINPGELSRQPGFDVIRQFLYAYRQFCYGDNKFYDIKMLPGAMAGKFSIDFMVCSGRLVCLQQESEMSCLALEALRCLEVKEVYHLPSILIPHIDDPAYLFSKTDFLTTTQTTIAGRSVQVSDLIGTIVDDFYSVGWDGRIAFQPVGIDCHLRIDPHKLRKFERQVTSEDLKRNRDLWKNRAVIAQKELGWQGLVLVKDDIFIEEEVKKQLAQAVNQALRGSRNAKLSQETLRGLKKPIGRYLKSLIATPDGENAARFLELLAAANSSTELQTLAGDILSWLGVGASEMSARQPLFPPTGGPVPFINATSLRKPKLLFLYKIVCKLSSGCTYSRDEIDAVIEKAAASLEINRKNDSRFQIDIVRRNLVDIGYLDRDTDGARYWLKKSSV